MYTLVYILYSQSLNKYYVGFTSVGTNERLKRHNQNYYNNKFTAVGHPWQVYLEIKVKNTSQGLAIEKHIKKMKSKTYIENLKKYPEMLDKLIRQYDNS